MLRWKNLLLRWFNMTTSLLRLKKKWLRLKKKTLRRKNFVSTAEEEDGARKKKMLRRKKQPAAAEEEDDFIAAAEEKEETVNEEGTCGSGRRRRILVDKQARCWSPPVLGRWKINTDAALDVAKGVVGVGIIIRNSLGQVAEAVALLLRISFAVNSGLCPASLESDATVVAAVVNTCAPLVPEFGTVLHDVLGAINCFNISPLRQRMR
ncbi:hypothetical protein ACOSQ4_013468 [Xanthoceras sorbifolium]